MVFISEKIWDQVCAVVTVEVKRYIGAISWSVCQIILDGHVFPALLDYIFSTPLLPSSCSIWGRRKTLVLHSFYLSCFLITKTNGQIDLYAHRSSRQNLLSSVMQPCSHMECGSIIGRQCSVFPFCRFFLCYGLTSVGVIQLSRCYLTQAVREPKGRQLWSLQPEKLCQCL